MPDLTNDAAEGKAAEDTTTEPVKEETTTTLPPEGKTTFLVVHTNEHGHTFATKVEADDEDHAREILSAAHTDNTIVNVQPWDGAATHGYGGAFLDVVDLNDEP